METGRDRSSTGGDRRRLGARRATFSETVLLRFETGGCQQWPGRRTHRRTNPSELHCPSSHEERCGHDADDEAVTTDTGPVSRPGRRTRTVARVVGGRCRVSVSARNTDETPRRRRRDKLPNPVGRLTEADLGHGLGAHRRRDHRHHVRRSAVGRSQLRTGSGRCRRGRLPTSRLETVKSGLRSVAAVACRS